MSPTTSETKLPNGYTLEPRHVCERTGPDAQRTLVLDREGRVLAVSDVLMPSGLTARESAS